jgi:hypothetical protein
LLSEITSGGPPRDGIPPFDRPECAAASRADAWLEPQEPVIVVTQGDVARAYPLQILIWHEIVNDVIGGRPVTVTFCPLCNTSLVYDRRVGGKELTFGTTGNLPGLALSESRARSPRTRNSSAPIRAARRPRETARRPKRRRRPAAGASAAPIRIGYDRADSPPNLQFFGNRGLDNRLPSKARVAVATFATPPVAYPIDELEHAAVVNDSVGGRRVVLLYLGGVTSPLDTRATASGTDVGQAVLFDPVLEGRALTFVGGSGKAFTDRETGSTWLVSGMAIAGQLAGRHLMALEHDVTYRFIWSVFRPETEQRRTSR